MSVRAPMGARKLILCLNYTPIIIFLQVIYDQNLLKSLKGAGSISPLGLKREVANYGRRNQR